MLFPKAHAVTKIANGVIYHTVSILKFGSQICPAIRNKEKVLIHGLAETGAVQLR